MMVFQTENYVSLEEKLGKGATGDVFKCYHKVSHEAFAAKVFPYHDTRSADSKRREIDILKKLDHPNIVKFYGLEYLRSDHGFAAQAVIITELCLTDMYAVISEPENAFGLEENTFKDLITQICKGLSYLYFQVPPVVHRDLKPGNILRSRRHGGGFLYKICDFGGAREMPESGEFFSIYGTPEYLAPAVFNKALITQTNSRNKDPFSSQIDLWSLGGTLYHLATGFIPFKPVRNPRDDKETMYHMINKKPAGAISCHQDSFGQLQYNNELPHTTCLSKSLRNLVTPILQGLLQDKNGMTHEECFNAVESIEKMQIVDIFIAKQSLLTKLYVRPGECLPLETILKTQLGININLDGDENCYFNNQLVHLLPDNIYNLKTTPTNPIIVTSDELENVEFLEVYISSNTYPKLKMKEKNLQDPQLGKEYCVAAYQFARSAKKGLESASLIELTKNNIQLKVLSDMENYRKACLELQKECEIRCSAVKKNEEILSKFKNIFGAAPSNGAYELDEDTMESLLKRMTTISENLDATLPKNVLTEYWKNITKEIHTENQSVWHGIIHEELKVIREIAFKFARDGTNISGYTELVHNSEKKRLRQSVSNIMESHDNILEQRNQLHQSFADWIRCSKNMSSRVTSLFKELEEIKSKLNTLYDEKVNYFESQLFDPIDKVKDQLDSMCQVAPKLLQIVKDHQNSMESLKSP